MTKLIIVQLKKSDSKDIYNVIVYYIILYFNIFILFYISTQMFICLCFYFITEINQILKYIKKYENHFEL